MFEQRVCAAKADALRACVRTMQFNLLSVRLQHHDVRLSSMQDCQLTASHKSHFAREVADLLKLKLMLRIDEFVWVARECRSNAEILGDRVLD